MDHRYFLFALVTTPLVATTFTRCELPVSSITFKSFSFIPRERPRVFVSHHPLRAIPGERVTIRLTPDLRAEDGAVLAAKAGLRRLNSDHRDESTCTQTGSLFECHFTLLTSDNDYVYDGYLELHNGSHVRALAAFRFSAAASIASNEVLTLREPVNTVDELGATYRVDTAWVHDPGDSYSFNDFLADVETSVYDGILADPVYRWRDNQLAFYVYGAPGFTSSYYSGLDTRCGQNPWPAEQVFRTALNSVEVIGVMHRHPSTGSGVEGTVAAAPNHVGVFRDCAGHAVKNPSIGTFSAMGGESASPHVAKHEYGHAAFGLGDEYLESTATRNVGEAIVNPLDCCCVSEFDGGTVIPGTGTGTTASGTGVTNLGINSSSSQCIVAGGGIDTGLAPSTGELRRCDGTFPPQCGATKQSACPMLPGECIQKSTWLGRVPPGDTSRLNSFSTEPLCNASRNLAAAHPGVEDRVTSIGVCRRICGGSSLPACPCGQAEGWIVDLNPADNSTSAADSMASVLAERLGGTCAWCIETTLCVRWQLALGNTATEAWGYCDAPPSDAAARERGIVAFVRALLDWIVEAIRSLTRNWRF